MALTTFAYIGFICTIFIIPYVITLTNHSVHFQGPIKVSQRNYVGDVYFGNDNIQISFDMKLNEICPYYTTSVYGNNITNGGCSILWITDDVSTTSFIFPRINIRVPLNNPSLLIAWSPQISRQSIPTLSVSLSNISDYIYDLNNYHHYHITYSPTTITLKIDDNDSLFFTQSGDYDFSQFLSQSYSLFITRYSSYHIIDAYLKNIYINSTSSIKDLSSIIFDHETIEQTNMGSLAIGWLEWAT